MRAARNHSRPQAYPAHRVKTLVTYDVHEVAGLCRVHRGTVRHWLKAGGLKAIDGSRPTLIHGSELKRFLIERRASRRRKCAFGEFFCFRCRKPRKAWGDTADARIHTEKLLKLTALCAECGTAMHRMVRRADLPKFDQLMEIRPIGPERLSDCSEPSENIDSCKGHTHEQAES